MRTTLHRAVLLFMIFSVCIDLERPVQLFAQHHPRQLMRKRHPRKRQAHAGRLLDLRGKSERASDTKGKAAGSLNGKRLQ